VDDGEARVRLVAETKASLAVLDAELQGHGKRFFGGDDLGFVDLAACTLAHWLGVLEEVAGVRLVAEGEYPALRRWAEQYTSHEVVRRSLPDRDQLVAFFAANQERYRSMVNAAVQQAGVVRSSSITSLCDHACHYVLSCRGNNVLLEFWIAL